MFGIRYLKSKPSDYIILYKKGRAKRQGAGLTFFYHAPTSSLVLVPAGSRDMSFIFQETTADFQTIDIQGQLTFRVTDALKMATMLDFSVDPDLRFIGDGPETLPARLTNLVQVVLRSKLRNFNLREALASSQELVDHATQALSASPGITELGMQVLEFSITKISPTPEIARALEASERENLLKEADQAIYERRNFAVEQERVIKENELQTEIAVEEKNRLIREEQMNAEIAVQEKQSQVAEARIAGEQLVARKKQEMQQEKLEAAVKLEERRKGLVSLRASNTVEEARARADAMKLELGSLNQVSPQLLDALVAAGMDPATFTSRALGRLADNAQKIGNLNISPDLIERLIDLKES